MVNLTKKALIKVKLELLHRNCNVDEGILFDAT